MRRREVRKADHGGDIFGVPRRPEGNVREEALKFGLVFKESFVMGVAMAPGRCL